MDENELPTSVLDPLDPFWHPGNLTRGTPFLRPEKRTTTHFIDPTPFRAQCSVLRTEEERRLPPSPIHSAPLPPQLAQSIVQHSLAQGIEVNEEDVAQWFASWDTPKFLYEQRVRRTHRLQCDIPAATAHYQRADSLCAGAYPDSHGNMVEELLIVDLVKESDTEAMSRLGVRSRSRDDRCIVSLYRVPPNLAWERFAQGRGRAPSTTHDAGALDLYRRQAALDAGFRPIETLSSPFLPDAVELDRLATATVPGRVFSVARSSCGRFVGVCCCGFGGLDDYEAARFILLHVRRTPDGATSLVQICDYVFSDEHQMLNGLRFGNVGGKERILLCSQIYGHEGAIYFFNLPAELPGNEGFDPTSVLCESAAELGLEEHTRPPEEAGLHSDDFAFVLASQPDVQRRTAYVHLKTTANFAVPSPDGETICVPSDGDRVYLLRRSENFQPTRSSHVYLTRPGAYMSSGGTGGLYCAFSPDSRHVIISSDRLMAVHVLETAMRRCLPAICFETHSPTRPSVFSRWERTRGAPVCVDFCPNDPDLALIGFEHGALALVSLTSLAHAFLVHERPPGSEHEDGVGVDIEGQTVHVAVEHVQDDETEDMASVSVGALTSDSDSDGIQLVESEDEGDDEDLAENGMGFGLADEGTTQEIAAKLRRQGETVLEPPGLLIVSWRRSQRSSVVATSLTRRRDPSDPQPVKMQFAGANFGLIPESMIPSGNELRFLMQNRNLLGQTLATYDELNSRIAGMAVLPSGLVAVATTSRLYLYPMPTRQSLHLGFLPDPDSVRSFLPPTFRAAARTILLAAASSSPRPEGEGEAPAALTWADLPRDVLLEILTRALFPLTCWMMPAVHAAEDGSGGGAGAGGEEGSGRDRGAGSGLPATFICT